MTQFIHPVALKVPAKFLSLKELSETNYLCFSETLQFKMKCKLVRNEAWCKHIYYLNIVILYIIKIHVKYIFHIS